MFLEYLYWFNPYLYINIPDFIRYVNFNSNSVNSDLCMSYGILAEKVMVMKGTNRLRIAGRFRAKSKKLAILFH